MLYLTNDTELVGLPTIYGSKQYVLLVTYDGSELDLVATREDIVRGQQLLHVNWRIPVSYTHLTLPTIYSV